MRPILRCLFLTTTLLIFSGMARAQRVNFELDCPVGTQAINAAGQVIFNPITGKFRQKECIDSTGNVIRLIKGTSTSAPIANTETGVALLSFQNDVDNNPLFAIQGRHEFKSQNGSDINIRAGAATGLGAGTEDIHLISDASIHIRGPKVTVRATAPSGSFLQFIAGISSPLLFQLPNDTTAAWPNAGIGVNAKLTGLNGANSDFLYQQNNAASQFKILNATGSVLTTIDNNGILNTARGTFTSSTALVLGLTNTSSIVISNTTPRTLTLPDATATLTFTVANGTATMTTALIGALACGTTVTVSATGVATTDNISWSFNAAPAVNPGELVISTWPTANNVNFQYCNPTAAGVTPNAATLNWRVVR